MESELFNLTGQEVEELRKIFYSQAYEIAEDLQELLLRLEHEPEDESLMKTIKRHVHTLKGDANSIGLTAVGVLCHKIEDIFSAVDEHAVSLDHDAVDILLAAVDALHNLLMQSEAGNTPESGDVTRRIDAYIQHVSAQGDHSHVAAALMHFTEYQQLQIKQAIHDSLRLYTVDIGLDPECGEKTVGVFMLAQRMEAIGRIIQSTPERGETDFGSVGRLVVLLASSQGPDRIKQEVTITGISRDILIRDFVQHGKQADNAAVRESAIKGQMLKVEISRVDSLMELVGELIIGQSTVAHLAKDLEEGTSFEDISTRLMTANAYMARTVADLQMGVMKIRMVPVQHVFRKFPKMVRELASATGKQIRLVVTGRDTEVDKGIVDALGEPLAHIIRNMADHGIEDPARRTGLGKPEEGTITLKAYHEATQIVIEVSDDGKGIDVERLRRKAVEKGFLQPDEAEKLTDKEAMDLMFLAGLSTAETVSETSGRGIGMDAVKASIEGLKGSIETASTIGNGTVFKLRLPLTLAVIKALLFEVGSRVYALPLSVVTEVVRVLAEDLKTIGGRDTMLLRERIISMISLDELLKTEGSVEKKRFSLILGMGNSRMGLIVDRIRGQEELVVKTVDSRYSHSGLVTGASILGNGMVVLILDAAAIFKKAVQDEKHRMANA